MKKLVMSLALIIFLCIGIFSVIYMQQEIPITYDGRGTDVYELQQNPQDYDVSDPEPDGVAAIGNEIISTDAEKFAYLLEIVHIGASSALLPTRYRLPRYAELIGKFILRQSGPLAEHEKFLLKIHRATSCLYRYYICRHGKSATAKSLHLRNKTLRLRISLKKQDVMRAIVLYKLKTTELSPSAAF